MTQHGDVSPKQFWAILGDENPFAMVHLVCTICHTNMLGIGNLYHILAWTLGCFHHPKVFTHNERPCPIAGEHWLDDQDGAHGHCLLLCHLRCGASIGFGFTSSTRFHKNANPESKKGNSRLEILVEYVGLTFLCILAHNYFEELNIGRMGLQAWKNCHGAGAGCFWDCCYEADV